MLNHCSKFFHLLLDIWIFLLVKFPMLINMVAWLFATKLFAVAYPMLGSDTYGWCLLLCSSDGFSLTATGSWSFLAGLGITGFESIQGRSIINRNDFVIHYRSNMLMLITVLRDYSILHLGVRLVDGCHFICENPGTKLRLPFSVTYFPASVYNDSKLACCTFRTSGPVSTLNQWVYNSEPMGR